MEGQIEERDRYLLDISAKKGGGEGREEEK